MSLPLSITLSAPSSAVANPYTATSNSLSTTPTIIFKSPGATGGGANAAGAGGVDIGSIVEIGFYGLLFIFALKEIRRG